MLQNKCHNTKPDIIPVYFTKQELRVYYHTIRDRSDVSDSYKLKIANAILDM